MHYTVRYQKKCVKLFRKEQKIFSRKQMSCFRENNLIIYSAKKAGRITATTVLGSV